MYVRNVRVVVIVCWVSILHLLELRMMEVVMTTGAIRCAKLQSNRHHQQTNTQFFLQAGCSCCRPTNSVRALKGKSITFHVFPHPTSHRDLHYKCVPDQCLGIAVQYVFHPVSVPLAVMWVVQWHLIAVWWQTLLCSTLSSTVSHFSTTLTVSYAQCLTSDHKAFATSCCPSVTCCISQCSLLMSIRWIIVSLDWFLRQ